MATKTISVDLEAYEILCRERSGSRDSFSQVIRRARWEVSPRSCGALLARVDSLEPLDEGVLDRLERAQATDLPPEDPWA